MLHTALAGMINYPQFFTWRLSWNAAKNKYDKVPAHPDGRIEYDEHGKLRGPDAQQPSNWHPYATAVATTNALNQRQDGFKYALGFMLTRAAGYWFLDMDNAVVNGQPSELAQHFFKNLPGAFFEYSSSGTGCHFLGRGVVPDHGTRCKEHGLEFYTQRRGICFGLTGQAFGSADTDHTAFVGALVSQVFPRAEVVVDGVVTNGPRPEWRGPEDDEELIRRAMASVSDAARLGGKATFADLWTRNAPRLQATYPPDSDADREAGYGQSEADLALAQHLAFWTGCDLERMVRLMLRSALVRPKWTEHRTYLRELTCVNAISRQRDVLVDKERVQQLAVDVTPEQVEHSKGYIQRILASEEEELRNVIIPEIAADRFIEALDRGRLADLVKQRLADFRIPVSISECRKMLWTEIVDDPDVGAEIPAWANSYVYVTNGDFFFHLETGDSLSRTSFNATFNRLMPMRQNGDREEAAKWALERWNMTTVSDTVYRPDKPLVFQEAAQWYANEFSPASIPAPTDFTQAGVEAINLFMRLLWNFTSGRQDVYDNLLSFMAHNVQFPGKKIRWAPLLKGIPGDGKSITSDVLMAAMGFKNVSKVGNKAMQADYNDWAGGSAVAAIEELMMTGSKRYASANSIKENITNNTIGLNRKGRTAITIRNVTNYIAYTNHVDAAPLEDEDRRWFIVFSPYHRVADILRINGLSSERELERLFTAIFESLDREPGQWRKWLLEMPIAPIFQANGRAPATEEKHEMQGSGEDMHDAIARQIIEEGAIGVTSHVICSASLTMAMRVICMAEGIEPPKTTMLNHMLSRLGFSKWGAGKVIKWDGRTRRVWWKRGSVQNPTPEAIRDILEGSKMAKLPVYESLLAENPTSNPAIH